MRPLLALLAALLVGAPLAAQELRPDWSQVKTGARVRVYSDSLPGRQGIGTLVHAGADEVVLQVGEVQVRLPAASVRAAEVSRGYATASAALRTGGTGLLVGAALGGGAGLLLSGGDDNGVGAIVLGMLGGVLGGVGGVVAGVATAPEVWRNVPRIVPGQSAALEVGAGAAPGGGVAVGVRLRL